MMKKKSRKCFFLIVAICVCMVDSFSISSATSRKICLSKNQVSLKNKQKYILKLNGTKNKKVKWNSSNKKIATVKNGVVIAKKKGKCIITAKCAKKKYKCIVNVLKKEAVDMNTTTTNLKTPNPSTLPNPSITPNISQVSDEGKRPDYSFSTIDDFSSIVMEAQIDSLNNMLMLKIDNNSGTDITTDNYFELEIFDEGKWSSVNFKANFSFEETIIVLKNGTDYVQNIEMKRYFTNLSKGRYRISKQISATNRGSISTEFSIE